MTELEYYINASYGVTEDNLKVIASFFHETSMNKGDYYLRTGRHANQLSFIKSGLLRIYVDAEDKEITQWISTKGYFVTDLASLIFDIPARWNIQAITDTSLYTISKTDYRNLGKLIPQWHELEKLFIAKCFTILEDRIFSHLSMTAEERYHLFFEQNKELFNQVPLQYIASMLGMTAETFSRIRKKSISQ